jgi:hypothetical protein
MATDFVYLTGKAKWCRATQPDPWGNWKIDLYLIPESVEKVNELKTTVSGVSGVKNELKKDEDGYYVTLRRPTQKMMRGKVVGFAPPEVLDKEGKPFHEPIGNGSDVTVKVSVYTHGTPGGGKARAMRWEAVRVDNHVPFQKQDFPGDRAEQVAGLAEQPEPLF